MMLTTITQPHPALPDVTLHALRAELTGDLVLPTDTTYDELRTLWNGCYDRHPALLVRPANAADVAAALRFARTYRLPVAVRGGGGNFGVVTTFTYQAHEIGTMVLGGPLVYTLDKAAAPLRHYRDFMATAPDALTLYAVFTTLPPAAPFPPHIICSLPIPTPHRPTPNH